MRIFVIIDLIFLLGLFANCQENNTSKLISNQTNGIVQITLKDKNCDSILITYNFENPSQDSVKFIIPRVIPGTYRYNDITAPLKKFKCFGSDNRILEFKSINDNEFLIPNSKMLKKIEYYVQKGNYKSVYDVLTKYVTTNTYSIVNTVSFLGYLNEYKNSKHTLIIESLKKKDSLIKNNNHIRRYAYNYDNFDELVENPHLYCKADTTYINRNNFKASIVVYSDNKNITSSLIAKWINSASSVLADYTSFLGNDKSPYRFMFIFSDVFDRDVALEQKNASTYCFRANWDTSFLATKIQHITAHEYLHRITPLYFQSNKFRNQLYKDYSSKHLWLYEGVVEYLALKANLDAKLITFKEFIEYLSMMYSSIDENSREKKSLLDLSQNILKIEDFNSFQDFYYKGGLIAFCLDLEISISTKGRKNLMTAISNHISHNGRIFSEEKFISNFLDNNKITNIDNNIFNNGFISHINRSLKKVGYYYSEDQKPWVESVINQFFIQKYYKNDEGFFIQFNENSELKNSTIRLLEIEQKNVQLEELLKKLIYPPNSNPVKITFESNGKVIKKTIKPLMRVGYRMIRRIKQQESINEAQKTNLNYFREDL